MLKAVGTGRAWPGSSVPVDFLEGQFAQVVEAGGPQQFHGPNSWQREFPGEGLRIVIEVQQQRLAAPEFHEAVGVTVETVRERFAVHGGQEVLDENVRLEVRHGPG